MAVDIVAPITETIENPGNCAYQTSVVIKKKEADTDYLTIDSCILSGAEAAVSCFDGRNNAQTTFNFTPAGSSTA